MATSGGPPPLQPLARAPPVAGRKRTATAMRTTSNGGAAPRLPQAKAAKTSGVHIASASTSVLYGAPQRAAAMRRPPNGFHPHARSGHLMRPPPGATAAGAAYRGGYRHPAAGGRLPMAYGMPYPMPPRMNYMNPAMGHLQAAMGRGRGQHVVGGRGRGRGHLAIGRGAGRGYPGYPPYGRMMRPGSGPPRPGSGPMRRPSSGPRPVSGPQMAPGSGGFYPPPHIAQMRTTPTGAFMPMPMGGPPPIHKRPVEKAPSKVQIGAGMELPIHLMRLISLRKQNETEDLVIEEKAIAVGDCTEILFGSVKDSALVSEAGKCIKFQLNKTGTGLLCCVDQCVSSDSASASASSSMAAASYKPVGKLNAMFQMAVLELFKVGALELTAVVKSLRVPGRVQRVAAKKKLFARSVDVSMRCKAREIGTLVKRIGKEKAKKWTNASTALKYFTGDSVNFELLRREVIQGFVSRSLDSGGGRDGPDKFAMDECQKDDFLRLLNDSELTAARDLDGEDPSDLVTTSLKQHQRVGLEWMLFRERKMMEIYKQMRRNDEDRDNDEIEDDLVWNDASTRVRDDQLPYFYRAEEDEDSGKVRYLNLLSKEHCSKEELPPRNSGAILADDMGLGKTLEMLALICSSNFGHGPTLIVAPTSVIGNWTCQIGEHLQKEAMTVYEYHGADRIKDVDVLKKFDIIMTSYTIVLREYRGETDENREEMQSYFGEGLQYVKFARVILDEAHLIRNRTTKQFKACCALQSASRWALTGTPVQNKMSDLYALFKFLRMHPCSDLAFWKKYVEDVIGTEHGGEVLRLMMSTACLRRLKTQNIDGRRIVDIGVKHIDSVYLSLSSGEHLKYRQLSLAYRKTFKEMERRNEVMKQYSSVLSMLLRLRQCCAHIDLVPKTVFEHADLRKEASVDLDELVNSNGECCFCERPPKTLDNAILTQCNHLYCDDCFESFVEDSGSFTCLFSTCSATLTLRSIKKRGSEAMEGEEADDESSSVDLKTKVRAQTGGSTKRRRLKDHSGDPSTKIMAMMDDIKLHMDEDKSVVFSQWTQMLDIIGACLTKEGIRYERLDGRMRRVQREVAMEKFKTDADIPVFLMSLQAGNLGLNMTAASRVYMMDPWWNPATEDQAIDRVYRLGQTKDVFVQRYVIRDSVEEKILDIQNEKRKLMDTALGGSVDSSNKAQRREDRMRHLQHLFD